MAGMDRRTFLSVMSGGVLATSLAAEAQQAGKVYRIGWLEVTPWMPVTRKIQDAFIEALRDRGFVEGQNVIFERRYSEGREDRYAGFVADLIRMRVHLILAASSAAVRAAKQATSTLPVDAPSPLVGEGICAICPISLG